MDASTVPTLMAGLLCDQIITEAGTNKKTLVGIFDTLHSPALPFKRQLWIYLRLTDAEGRYRFRIELVHLETEKPIFGVETNEVEAKNRLGFHEIVVELPPVPLPDQGTYEFQIYANDVYIGRILLKAELVKSEGN